MFSYFLCRGGAIISFFAAATLFFSQKNRFSDAKWMHNYSSRKNIFTISIQAERANDPQDLVIVKIDKPLEVLVFADPFKQAYPHIRGALSDIVGMVEIVERGRHKNLF